MNKILKSILLILSYFVFYVIIYIPFVVMDINLSTIPDSLFNIYFINMEILFVVGIIWAYKDDFKKYINDFKLHGKKHLEFGFHYWFIGLLAMVITNLLISFFSPIAVPENEQAIREMLKVSPLFIIITSVITVPFIEEMIFRRAIFSFFKNENIYIIVSGLIFGFAHVAGIATSLYSWLYIIPYASVGIAFAYIFSKTKNLFTSIFFHALHNFMTVIFLLISSFTIWGKYEEEKTLKNQI